jgi:hypothetical protein
LVGLGGAAQAAPVDLLFSCGVFLEDPALGNEPALVQEIAGSVGTDIPAEVTQNAAVNANAQVTLKVSAELAGLMAGDIVQAATFDASLDARMTVGGANKTFADSVAGAAVLPAGFDVPADGSLGAVPTSTLGAATAAVGGLDVKISLFKSDGSPANIAAAWLQCAAPAAATVTSYTVKAAPAVVPTNPVPTVVPTVVPTTPAVVKVATTTAVKVTPKALKAGGKATLKVSVSGGATGSVKVVVKGKAVAKKTITVTLKGGKGKVKLSKLKKGKLTVTASYLGAAGFETSNAKKVTATVK